MPTASTNVTGAFEPDSHINSGVGTPQTTTAVASVSNQVHDDGFKVFHLLWSFIEVPTLITLTYIHHSVHFPLFIATTFRFFLYFSEFELCSCRVLKIRLVTLLLKPCLLMMVPLNSILLL